MNKIVNGELITLSPQEEAEAIAEAAQREPAVNALILEKAKQRKIKTLRENKLDELLSVQIQAVNNAQNQAAIDAVTL